MTRDNERDNIRNIQRYLRQISYTDKDISSPPIDGIFEDATRSSLLDFQRKYRLEASGVVDRRTFDKLYEEYLLSLRRSAPPLPLNVFPRTPKDYELSFGDSYFAVSILQSILNELSVIYDGIELLEISGVYDAPTRDNVLYFQELNRIAPTGKVDKTTWDALIDAYDNYAYDYIQ